MEIPQVQFLDQLFIPLVMPTLVEIPQVQFSDLLFMSVVMRTPVEIPQVQFSDKDSDVPVFNDTCPRQSRQLQFLDKVTDVLVISTSRAHGDPDSAVLVQRC